MSKNRIASNLTNYPLLIDSGLSINMLYFCRLGCSTSISGKLAEEYCDGKFVDYCGYCVLY